MHAVCAPVEAGYPTRLESPSAATSSLTKARSATAAEALVKVLPLGDRPARQRLLQVRRGRRHGERQRLPGGHVARRQGPERAAAACARVWQGSSGGR
ncbi:MAG: hypothetical protein WDW38_011245 [Sanguina aurantia]